ncbi:Dual oxidase maturation factor 2 [Entophlyctis luteolus]|nr:Dual oxidase maturation factor 2 [Entophlyctis luteolus]
MAKRDSIDASSVRPRIAELRASGFAAANRTLWVQCHVPWNAETAKQLDYRLERALLVGRIGYGRFSSPTNRHHREREEFGVPYPIQAISEYMTLDGEYFRWGRHFRQAGMFTYLQSRTAFGIWLVALALFVIKAQASAANTLVVLAILQSSACITYYCITSTLPFPQPDAYANINPFRAGANQNQLAIPFKDGILTPRLHISYAIAWSAAVVSLVLGVFANPRFATKSSSENPEITSMVVEWERRHFAQVHSRSHKSVDSISTL